MMEKQRDYSFDYIKGILIFLVVLGHCIRFYLKDSEADEMNFWGDPLFVFIYSFHMPLFVFTTGYFFSSKIHQPLYKLVPIQFKRLLYPQFAWDLVILVVILLQFDMFGDQLIGETTTSTVKKIYHFITSTWYLWCVFFCGIFTVLAYKTAKPLTWLACFCILMFVFYDYLPDAFFKHQQITMQLPFFVFGVVVHKMEDGDRFMRKMLWPSLVGYLACWGVYLCMDCNFGGFPTLPKFLWAVFGVVLMYNVFKYMFRLQIATFILQNWGGIRWEFTLYIPVSTHTSSDLILILR